MKTTKKEDDKQCKNCLYSTIVYENISNDNKPIFSKCEYSKFYTLLNWSTCTHFKQKL